ncbi:hypothetical protein AB834_03585 [PVC group bacterium (ex Bugula neritina AB1)]|nr:hypothetical protein AB834_03585 [PVC group bacterium (ex Bugula neritina AB1)]
MRINKIPIFSVGQNHLIDYPSPKNISYFWGFGLLSGFILFVQIVTGIFLAIHYTPNVSIAFISVEHIIRDVFSGWLLRYIHSNGASFFFIVVYFHIFRGLFYGSFVNPREALWCSGVVIFILMMGTGFIGYVLPWGQMSFWGATVITNLISAIPLVGDSIVLWVWGGFSVDNPTLNRFFSLHYLFPFLIVGFVFLHLACLHLHGSNNPIGLNTYNNSIPFYPYFFIKDSLGIFILLIVFSFFLFFYPNILGHPDNYIPANPIVTPAHIVPEWYFLPFYAILRSIPHKLGGVIIMFGAILCFIFIPFITSSEFKSTSFRPLFKKLFWLFVVDCFVLGWVGQNEVESPFIEIGQISTLYYFVFLLVIIPITGRFESSVIRYVK